MESNSPRKRRWLRFSLRTLLLVTLVAGIAFGLISREARNRRAALSVAREYGARITFDSKPRQLAWYEKFLTRFFGEETYQPVRIVNMLTDGHITPEKKVLPDDFLQRLSALSEIQSLGLENTIIAETDWPNIRNFRRVEYMLLSYSNISDAGMNYLSELPVLDTISANSTKLLTDNALPAISRMPKLTNLKLDSAKLTDEGLRKLTAPRLRILELQSVKITSRGAEALKQLPTLHVLLLDWSNVDDQAFEYFAALPALQILQLHATKVTQAGIDRFRAAHPTCKVTGP